jgi:FkbM family methyltransferase
LRLSTTTLFTGQSLQFYAGRKVGPLKYGFWDAHITSALIALVRGGEVVLDVGAHVGYYTAIASHLVGPTGSIHAFEPTPKTASILRHNTIDMANVIVHEIALSDRVGTVTLLDYGPEHSGLNTIAGKARGKFAELPTPEGIEVPCSTLDIVLSDAIPRFVKIDAESAEASILRGMERILTVAKPVLLIEVGDFGIRNSSTSDTMAWLARKGYRPYEWNGAKLVAHEARDRYLPDDIFYIHEDQSTTRT